MHIFKNTFGQVAVLASAFILGSFSAKGQLQVSAVTGTSAQQAHKLAQLLAGSGVQVSYASTNASPILQLPFGKFNGVNSNIGLDSGVILTTGLITSAPGPNTLGSTSNPGTGLMSDQQLTALANGQALNDVCILEFDLVPQNDSLTFRYVFGSEEYNEFVCSNFNDVFGFFINGPGIVTNINQPGVRNLSLIPGLQSFVSINTVNNGSCGGVYTPGPGTDLSNSQNFVDNTNGTTVGYDGLTVVLTVGAVVIPGQLYHLKLAIADVSDASYDSGVFIEAGSIVSPVRLGTSGQLANEVASSIYPNPVGQSGATLHLGAITNGAAGLEISITDALGRQVYSASTPATQQGSRISIPTSTLSAGIFHYQVKQEGAVISRGRFSVAR
jgi:hypothetical protein